MQRTFLEEIVTEAESKGAAIPSSVQKIVEAIDSLNKEARKPEFGSDAKIKTYEDLARLRLQLLDEVCGPWRNKIEQEEFCQG